MLTQRYKKSIFPIFAQIKDDMNKLFLIGWLALMTLLACEGDRRHGVRLLEAERLVDTRPDSALLLLEQMGDPADWPENERAWWALLKVWDKSSRVTKPTP